MTKPIDDENLNTDNVDGQSGAEGMGMKGNSKGHLDRLLANMLSGKPGAQAKLYAFFMENRFNLALIKPAINKLLELQNENVYAREFTERVDYKADFNLRHLFAIAETTAAEAELKAAATKKEPVRAFNPSPLRTRLTPKKSDFDEV